MSLYHYESALKRARDELSSTRTKQAKEETKCAAAESAASEKVRKAQGASSESMRKSYLREADRKQKDADRARSAAAKFSEQVARAQTKVIKAETALDNARAAQEKKRLDENERHRKKRDQDEKRQRDAAARASKRADEERRSADRARQMEDSARDSRLSSLGTDVSKIRSQGEETKAILDSRPWEQVPRRITVLILTSEPDGEERLRIDREIREIQDQVRSSDLRDSIDFVLRPATRFTDIIQHLNETEPDVIHFSGHSSTTGIALHDDEDAPIELSSKMLDRVLAIAPKPLTLVILNSCQSVDLARVAASHAAAAIGMETSINDEAARIFAGQLYNSLGFGRSLGLAMQQAELAVEMKLNRPSGKPTLILREGLSASDLVVVDPRGQDEELPPFAATG